MLSCRMVVPDAEFILCPMSQWHRKYGLFHDRLDVLQPISILILLQPATSTGTGTSSVPVITSSAPTTRTTPYRTSTTFLTGTALASHTQVPYTSLECNNADCGSGTIYPDITAVNDSMPWHYSVSANLSLVFM